MVEEGADLGCCGLAVGAEDERAVVIVADPEFAEGGEAHFDRALLSESLHLTAGSVAAGEEAIKRCAVRQARLSSTGATGLESQDVEQGLGEAVGPLLAELNRPGKDFLRESGTSAITAQLGAQALDATGTVGREPRIHGSLADPNRSPSWQVVRLPDDLAHEPRDLAGREVLGGDFRERCDHPVAE